jgi:hypothetical protein
LMEFDDLCYRVEARRAVLIGEDGRMAARLGQLLGDLPWIPRQK